MNDSQVTPSDVSVEEVTAFAAAELPFFAEYQRGTQRRIPVVVLERVGEG